MQLRVVACVLLGLVVLASAGMYNGRSGYKKSSKPFVGRVTEPMPSEYIKAEDLPKNWDWRNVSNVNYVTWSRNQHIPTYCGGCWSFATTSALSDRLAIQRKNVFPEINLAPQALINCEGGGDCDGGDPGEALEYIAQNGIPDETCAPYQAVNGLGCTPTCQTCWPSGCVTINNFNLYTVTQYNGISGVDAMKAEIFARGPIACLVDATDRFEQYTGGIYSEYLDDIEYDHVISVVGWGVSSDGTEYWIGRNSWGTYWGEHGWFQIVLGRPNHNLGIEGACYWGVPSLMNGNNQN